MHLLATHTPHAGAARALTLSLTVAQDHLCAKIEDKHECKDTDYCKWYKDDKARGGGTCKGKIDCSVGVSR